MLDSRFVMDRSVPADLTLFSRAGSADDMPRDRMTTSHQAVMNYWLAKRGGRAVTRRADFDPVDLGAHLPGIMLWEIDEIDDYRVRLAGTGIEAITRCNLQGVSLRDLPSTELAQHYREFNAVRHGGQINFSEHTMAWADQPYAYWRHLLMPLADLVGRIHMLVSVLTVHPLGDRYLARAA